MANIDLVQLLYSSDKSPMEFSFDKLMARPLLSLLTPQDIYQLNKIATSLKLSSKPKEKYRLIDNIMVPRGFKKIASGTNRITYKYLNDMSICVKIALDKVGLNDNPREYENQFLLKPFVTKVFEVSPCGTVGLFERVNPITSIEEYMTVADSVYSLLTTILGKYVLDDVGTRFFQNIGVRNGFGVVLLDFPYVYELDGDKLFCNKIDPVTGQRCGGEIDYDSGFNNIICTKCGKQYYAKQLEKLQTDKLISVGTEGDFAMKIRLVKEHKTVKTFESEKNSNVIKGEPKNEFSGKIRIEGGDKCSKKEDRNRDKGDETANERISKNDYKGDVNEQVYAKACESTTKYPDGVDCSDDCSPCDEDHGTPPVEGSEYPIKEKVDKLVIKPRHKDTEDVSDLY